MRRIMIRANFPFYSLRSLAPTRVSLLSSYLSHSLERPTNDQTFVHGMARMSLTKSVAPFTPALFASISGIIGL